MHIGMVMFFKGIAVATGATVLERYRAFKKRRREKGIPLRLDKRRNAYVADDRLERAETLAKRIGLVLLVPLILYAVLVFYLLLS